MKENKIALVICPCWGIYCPPLGIAVLSSALKQKGFSTRCFDLNIEAFDSLRRQGFFASRFKIDIKKHGIRESFILKTTAARYWDFKNYSCWQNDDFYDSRLSSSINDYLKSRVKDILEYGADIIGFSVFASNVRASLFLASEIKKAAPEKKIVFGGPECSAGKNVNFRYFKKTDIDAVVIGEGEKTIIELAEAYFKKGILEGIAGTALKTGDEFIEFLPRPLIKDLDELPFPEYGDFDLKKYYKPALPISISRGCVAKCSFCEETLFWNKYRFRKAENVFAEIQNGVSKYGVKEFLTHDSLVNGNMEELLKLVDLILKKGLNIKWGGYARVSQSMNPETLGKLKAAGCAFLSYGIESGSQKVLDNMKKGFTIDVAEKNLKDTCRAGILTQVNWMVGFPTETFFDFLKSLKFIFKNRRFIDNLLIGPRACVVVPAADLGVNPEKYGISAGYFLGSWRTADFRNTIIHRYVRLKITLLAAFLLRIKSL